MAVKMFNLAEETFENESSLLAFGEFRREIVTLANLKHEGCDPAVVEFLCIPCNLFIHFIRLLFRLRYLKAYRALIYS